MKVASAELASNEGLAMDVAGLAAGIYVLKITEGDNSAIHTEKIVILK